MSQNRHTLLKALKEPYHTPDQLDQLFSSTSTISIHRLLYKKALQTLILLDIKVSVFHDYIIQSEWDHITSPYQTPSDNYTDIKSSIADLKRLFFICCKTEPAVFFSFFEKNILMLKTKHIQFILFEYDPLVVLSFFLNGIENHKAVSNYFVTYIFAFLVRRKMDCEIVKRVVEKLVQIYEKNNVKRLVFLQGFVYLCCFKKEMFKRVEDILIRDYYMLKNVNEKIMQVFCSIYKWEVKCVEGNCALLEWFPFDPSPIEEIFSKYRENYLIFNKNPDI